MIVAPPLLVSRRSQETLEFLPFSKLDNEQETYWELIYQRKSVNCWTKIQNHVIQERTRRSLHVSWKKWMYIVWTESKCVHGVLRFRMLQFASHVHVEKALKFFWNISSIYNRKLVRCILNRMPQFIPISVFPQTRHLYWSSGVLGPGERLLSSSFTGSLSEMRKLQTRPPGHSR